MELSQDSNQESNLTNKWKYHKIVIKNQIWQTNGILRNCNQKSSLITLQNITQNAHPVPETHDTRLERASHAKRRENNETDTN